MNLNALKNTSELQSFLNGSQAVAFSLPGKKEDCYGGLSFLSFFVFIVTFVVN